MRAKTGKNCLKICIGAFFGLLFILPGVSSSANEEIFFEDNANILDDSTKEQIQKYNRNYENLEDHPRLYVVTMDKLPREVSIEEYSMLRMQELKVGEEAENTVVIYTIAIKDKKTKLEVGTGIKDVLPNALEGKITSPAVKDFYRKSRYSEGIDKAIAQVDRLIMEDADTKRMKKDKNSQLLLIVTLIVGIVLGVSVFFLRKRCVKRKNFCSVSE